MRLIKAIQLATENAKKRNNNSNDKKVESKIKKRIRTNCLQTHGIV